MPNILVLDQATINKIAAGEVIERPSSVVKELVENAIDAGATAITVEIREGGISFIRITDNGCGIPAGEIALAFQRHATSKITSVEDLLTVSSLGFRGEALSSIAAVAQVELITRTDKSLTGIRYCVEGGVEKRKEEVGAPVGTTFVVRNLFFNTPARRKFLKTAQTEGAYISALVERMALSHPEISFRLLVNGQSKLHTAGNHRLRDIIYTIYGREITAELLTIDVNDGPVKIHGFLGKPIISRGNRSYENYYINGRYIKSGLITKAIENAYHGFVMQHKYPFTVLHLELDPSWLDVNVHPTKMELRFRDEELIYNTVFNALRVVLTGRELIPQVTVGKDDKVVQKPVVPKNPEHGPEPFELRRLEKQVREAPVYQVQKSAAQLQKPAVGHPVSGSGTSMSETEGRHGTTGSGSSLSTKWLERAAQPGTGSSLAAETKNERTENIDTDSAKLDDEKNTEKQIRTDSSVNVIKVNDDAKQIDLFEEKILTRQARAEYRLIGQLFDTYWLVQYQDKFLMIDQHAAHEKVLYERTMKGLASREYTCQQLQPPIILTLNAREEQVLLEYMEKFESIGFEIEHFGGKEYAVYGVPGNLFSIAKQELLLEMLDGLVDETSRNSLLIEEKVALMSCKAAVKGNNRLSVAEADALIDELLNLENPYTCPHGRPTIISMTQYELEKKFKRIVT